MAAIQYRNTVLYFGIFVLLHFCISAFWREDFTKNGSVFFDQTFPQLKLSSYESRVADHVCDFGSSPNLGAWTFPGCSIEFAGMKQ